MPMPIESSIYKGKRIIVESGFDEPQLRIDNKPIDVNRDSDSGTFGSSKLPYREFESIEELSKALVDEREKWLPIVYRKSAVELTGQEQSQFINAVKKLKNTMVPTRDGTGKISRYDQFVAIHLGVTKRYRPPINKDNQLQDGAHRNAAFCAWHREFLWRFEMALQDIDPAVSLPYWDWTQHEKTKNVLFQDSFMGPNGGTNGIGGGTVQSGHFAETNGWSVNARLHIPYLVGMNPPSENYGTALIREFRSFEELASPDDVRRALRQRTFREFRPVLEYGPRLHGFGHVWIGGSMKMMSSPQDPIFFLHHANVDRVWAIWQENGHEGANFYPAKGRPYGHNLTNRMWPWDGGEVVTVPWIQNLVPEFPSDDIVRPLDVLDYQGDRLGYSYV